MFFFYLKVARFYLQFNSNLDFCLKIAYIMDIKIGKFVQNSGFYITYKQNFAVFIYVQYIDLLFLPYMRLLQNQTNLSFANTNIIS